MRGSRHLLQISHKKVVFLDTRCGSSGCREFDLCLVCHPTRITLGSNHEIRSVLKEGGLWIIRDYAKGDAAKTRFNTDRQLDHDLFVRQDGTLSRFFDKDHTHRTVKCKWIQHCIRRYNRIKDNKSCQGHRS